MNANQPREETILEQALEFASAESRQAYLQGACGDDEQLRLRVESLMEAHQAAGGFLRDKTAHSARTLAEGSSFDEGPGTVIGRYKLLQKIGEGGMGVVYMAEQQEPVTRKVALKIIKLGMDTKQVIARFEAERQALAMMDHPNIARVFDAGATEAPHPASNHPAHEPTPSPLPGGEPATGTSNEAPLLGGVGGGFMGAMRDKSSVSSLPVADRRGAGGEGHPHLSAGRPYFVMELVQGVPITEFCDKNHLTAQARIDLFIPVCQAIQSAHQKGIIHRDIKPSNVLVTLHHGEPMPKVIDFGIAKATNQKLTEKTLFTNYATMIGTPAYMSPEQAEMTSLDVDTRTDVYALGVLLYELLTGTTPFPEKRLRSVGYGEMQRIIVEEEPEKPSTRLGTMANEQKTVVAKNRGTDASDLSKLFRSDLDWIVLKCLEKDRRRRYDTPNELVADLKRHLEDEPVFAAAPSFGYQLQKFYRRNPVTVTAAAAVFGALLIGLFIASWQAVRAKNAERLARLAQLAEKQQSDQARQDRDRAVQAEAEAHEKSLIAEDHRQQAETAKKTAQGNLYVANMNLIQQAWEQNNIGRVRQLLKETASHPDRGFEWYYWHRQTHQALMTLRGHSEAVMAMAFSPDGQRIVTGSGNPNPEANVWETASGRELFRFRGHTSGIWSLAFSPDGQRIVSGSGDRTAKVWETANGKELLTLRGHMHTIMCVAFSPDGQRIITGSVDQTAKVWDAASGTNLLTIMGHTRRILSVAFSPDGRQVFTGSEDQTARVWNAATGEQMQVTTLSGPVNSLAFSPDGQRIVTNVTWDRTAKVWEAGSGKELLTLEGHTAQIITVAFSSDGQRIVTTSVDMTTKVWKAASGKELVTLKGHTSFVRAAISWNGQRVVTGSGDQTAKVWDVAGDSEPFTIKGDGVGISTVGFSPDGQRILTGSLDRAAKVWELSSGKELFALKGLSGRNWSMGFSPDGQRIITGSEGSRGSEDQTAKVWEAASGKELLTLKGHTDGVLSVAFSPDGQRIVTGSLDRTARVWQIVSAQQVSAWQKEEQAAAESMAAQKREQAAAAERARSLPAQNPAATEP